MELSVELLSGESIIRGGEEEGGRLIMPIRDGKGSEVN